MRPEDTQRCLGPDIGDINPIACDLKLKPCHICGSAPEMQEIYKGNKNYSKVVCCSNGSEDGFEDCPLFMPLAGFEKATMREAAEIWNKRANPQIGRIARS